MKIAVQIEYLNSDFCFYNYILCNPLKPGEFKVQSTEIVLPCEPFYVGKGCNSRVTEHETSVVRALERNDEIFFNEGNVIKKRIIRKILRSNLRPLRIIPQRGISESEAIDTEIFLIKAIGRMDLGLGTLCNLTDGGEGTSGYKHTKPAHNKKSIVVYNPKTFDFDVFDCIDEYLGADNIAKGSKVRECCNCKKAQYKGLIVFYWKDYSEEYLKTRIEQFNKWKVEFSKRYKRRKILFFVKPIIVFDPISETCKRFESVREYLGEFEFRNNHWKSDKIHVCCREERKHFDGKIFFFEKDFTEEKLKERLDILKSTQLLKKTKELIFNDKAA